MKKSLDGRAFSCHIRTWEGYENLEYKCDLPIGLTKHQPCANCPLAAWIDKYGKLTWGCDMPYCIEDEDTF